MKKSKIIGLTLNISTLAVTTLVTPFLVTSCKENNDNSNNENNPKPNENEITAMIEGLGEVKSTSKTEGEILDDDYKIQNDPYLSNKKNEITVYSGATTTPIETGGPTGTHTISHPFILVNLTDDAKQIINEVDLKQAGFQLTSENSNLTPPKINVFWACKLPSKGWEFNPETNTLKNIKPYSLTSASKVFINLKAILKQTQADGKKLQKIISIKVNFKGGEKPKELI